jgi:ribosomal-protein-alanine N-acetyltransferase
MGEIFIERLSEKTLSGAARLEELCFSSPWSRESLSLLCREGAVGFAAVEYENGDVKVWAYGGMLTVLDEGQITNIATHPDARRRGLGEKVTGALLEYGEDHGLTLFSLEVRESNFAAIALYEKLGFKKAGIRKNFYKLPTENAVIMIKEKGTV